jgi:CPA2 family monovalent cation:H+ antiporter-2
MPHQSTLILIIVAGLGLAFVFGALANRLKLSPLVGYLLAGVMMGPFTPGYVADQALAMQLAEIGVILLMFGVGLHFSLSDLLSVRAIAIPGTIAQIAVIPLLGTAVGWLAGWPLGGGVVFGLALSVASTVVVLRTLQERRLIETERGRITVGWLIVQDLAMVLTLVLLPAFSGMLGGDEASTDSRHGGGLVALFDPHTVWQALGLTIAKVAVYVAIMLVVGRRVIPWILHYIAHTGSRELFRLAVLAIALGVAYGSAALFGVSFALGAFFAGMILAESTLSQQAANETLPLRDAFAVLFFVSVGMLCNPGVLLDHPFLTLAAFVIIVAGNGIVAFGVVRLFGYPYRIAFAVGACLAQIGEFSFILGTLGVDLKLLPEAGRDIILVGALMSIVVNPLIFLVIDRLGPWIRAEDERAGLGVTVSVLHPGTTPPLPGKPAEPEPEADAGLPPTDLADHAVLIGYGRVGSRVGEDLVAKGQPLLVIEERRVVVESLRARGIEAILGNAAQEGMLEAANIAGARWLISAIPNPFESANLVEQGRIANPDLHIIARAHSDDEVAYLKKYGADLIIVGEVEIARGMTARIGRDIAGDEARQAAPGSPAAPPASASA